MKFLPLHIHFQYFHHLLGHPVNRPMAQIDRQFRFDSITNFLIASQRLLNSESSYLHGLLKNALNIIRRSCVMGRLPGNLVDPKLIIVAEPIAAILCQSLCRF